MSVIKTSINRPVTISMVTVGVLAFGLIGLRKLPINLLPDLSYPTLTLETKYPGAAPEEVEYLVTRQIEEAVAVIPRIKSYYSSSKAELSQVTIEFEWGRQMDFAILDVSKKVDLLRLPDGVEKPRILRYDPNQDPILKVSVLSEGMPLTELRWFCEEELKKRLDVVPGLAAVKVSGGQEEVIEIRLKEAELKRYGLEIGTVTRRLMEENINRAGGSLYENDARYLVRTLNEYESIADIESTIITRVEDRKVHLRDIAEVAYGFKDRDLIARIDGSEGVELDFYKEGDANTVQVSRELKIAVKDLQEKFTDRVTMKTTFEGAAFIENSIAEVISNAAIGGLIAIIILFLFLRDLKSTLIVSITIPVSIFLTFFLMLIFDVSLNIMSLGGLALGVGMLVDNSIVVLESIFVRRRFGDSYVDAAANGASLVAGAVTASTLTTIVVFLPIVFIEGIAGQLFRDLGMTVSFALLGSLAVSLTLIPTLFVLFSRFGSEASTEGKVIDDEELEVPKGAYVQLLALCLRHRFLILAGGLATIFLGYVINQKLAVNLIPEMVQGEYFALVELEEGTPIEATDEVTSWIEAGIKDLDGIAIVFTTVGEFNQGVDERRGENLSQINFSLKSDVAEPNDVVNRVREVLDRRQDVEYQIGTPSYFTFRTPIEIEIYSDDQKVLKQASDSLTARMNELGLFKDVRTTVADGNPEVQIHFKRETMSKLGLSIGDVSQMLRDKIQGTSPTRFARSGRDVDIMVRLKEADRNSLNELEALTVGYREGKPIFLSTIAEIETETGPSQIRRVEKERCAVISAGLIGNDLGAASAAMKPLCREIENAFPVTAKITGQAAEKEKSFGSMFFVIGLAVFLVYLVMASQFESLLYPFLILVTVPIGLVGGLIALYLTGLEISVIALIGMIMLAGIVVNNAIVMIDYINHLRSRGLTLYHALLLGGQRRLRPILMTTTTTVLGLIPMALGLGEGAEMRTPLAITVIGGLVFSTLLTLFLVPVMYGTVTKGLVIPEQRHEAIGQEVLT